MSEASELEAYLHERIPMARLMGISVVEASPLRVELGAPLSLNHNHLGTAFGGSVAAVATLAGYAALWTTLADRAVHVVVRRGSVDYRQPVSADIHAVCELPPGTPDDTFRRSLASRGKARMELEVKVIEAGELRAVFRGEFVALKP